MQERTKNEGTIDAQSDPVGICITGRSVEQISCLRADDRIGAEAISVELLALTAGLRNSTGGAARAVDELRAPKKGDDLLLEEEPVVAHMRSPTKKW
jgi:hypothetical protein